MEEGIEEGKGAVVGASVHLLGWFWEASCGVLRDDVEGGQGAGYGCWAQIEEG